jgi:hypothetical protein
LKQKKGHKRILYGMFTAVYGDFTL